MDLKQLLWRVVYTKNANLHSSSFCAGPWHPDKAHVERCAEVLRARQLDVGIQSNQQAQKNATQWNGLG